MTQQPKTPELIPAVWVESDKPYLVHRVAGHNVTPGEPETHRFVTACETKDVPAGEARFYDSRHRPNCPECRNRVPELPRDESRARQWIEAKFPRLKQEAKPA